MQRWAHGDALEPLVFMDTSVMLFVFSVLGFQSTFGGDSYFLPIIQCRIALCPVSPGYGLHSQCHLDLVSQRFGSKALQVAMVAQGPCCHCCEKSQTLIMLL